MSVPAICRRDTQYALVIREQVEADGVGAALERILPQVAEYAAGIGAIVAGAAFTRYLGFSSEGLLEIEAGVPTLDPMPGDAFVSSEELPGGECVCLMHYGDYQTLPASHLALDEWFDSSGRQPSGPRWEAYLTDPGAGADQWNRQTLITQPLEPLQ
jgi:effector-binding domain-containing protein